MAIRHRRGLYSDFNATKMVSGEFAVVQSDDPTTSSGEAIYISFHNGSAKRLATEDDIDILPSLSSSDNGKFIMVNSSGRMIAQTIQNAEGVSF